MAIKNLIIIGEGINYSIPSTHILFEDNNLNGIKTLAKLQDNKGASYLDVNVGNRPPAFMKQIVREIQTVTAKPLCIDSPDFNMVNAGLAAYNTDKAGGKIPILNSISPLRTKLFNLYEKFKFKPILMVSESSQSGTHRQNRTAQQIYDTAKEMLTMARDVNIPDEYCIFDVGIAPVAIDDESLTRRTYESLKLLSKDNTFNKCSFTLGLSNFSHMLPAKRASDGLPVRSSLESALLTVLMPLGLNMIIGSVRRNYQLLPDNHPARILLHEILSMDGFDTILKLQNFLSS